MSTHRPSSAITPPHPPASVAETEALDAIQVEYDVLHEVIAFAQQLCDTHQLPHPVQNALITPYQTRRDALARHLQLPDPFTRLADLEHARTNLIQTYQSKLAEITTARTSLQTAPDTTPIPRSPPQDSPALPSFPPLSPDTPVHHASTLRTPRTSVIGWLASTVAVTWSVTTPQYVFSVLPPVPMYPILLTIGLGLLMGLVTMWNDTSASRTAASAFGMLYALLVGIPFLATWLICSWTAIPTWPAALAGLLGPSLLLLHTYHPTRIGARYLDTAMIRFDDGPWATALMVLASLFDGYGSIILTVFLTTVVTHQPFSPTVVDNLGVLLLIGAALSSGIYRRLQHAS
jgi:hypothetical protein